MIAISYRREDSLPIAGRLYDRLQAKFGKDNVFMDFDSIPPGVDFREQIKQTIERSSLVVAVIGSHWFGEHDDGTRRIDDPNDFVRLEIAYALKRGIPVIPLLINNTAMPKPEKLPPELEGLAFRHAVQLDSGIDFHNHADRLINGICGLVDVNRMQHNHIADAGKTRPAAAVTPKTRARPPRPSKILSRGTLPLIVWAGVLLFFIWFFGVEGRQKIDKSQQDLATQPPMSTAEVATGLKYKQVGKQKLVPVFVKAVGFRVSVPIEIFPDAAILTSPPPVGDDLESRIEARIKLSKLSTSYTGTRLEFREHAENFDAVYEFGVKFANTNSNNVRYKAKADNWFVIQSRYPAGDGDYKVGINKEGKAYTMTLSYLEDDCPFSAETLTAMAESFIASSR